jgi:D-3-phosphoglycerate dehydrogenase / 2-oxoglutarate reductase
VNILLIDHFPPEVLEGIASLGVNWRYEPEWTAQDVYAHLSPFEILVMNSKVRADAELLAHGPNLKMICRAGAGIDHFDLPLLEQRGIKSFSTPGANAISVAEQATGMLLSLMHSIARADRQVHEWKWRREENRGTELYGKTVGIIGYGNTGSSFARCLSGFGCRVLAYDKYKSGFANSWVEEVPLEAIFDEAQILSLHVPLTAETTGWVNSEFLSRFLQPIWFLNLARGPIVPLEDLLLSLESGKVIAAGLDVLENENLGALTEAERNRLARLLKMDRVILTPHIGGWSRESLARITNRLLEGIADFVRGHSTE